MIVLWDINQIRNTFKTTRFIHWWRKKGLFYSIFAIRKNGCYKQWNIWHNIKSCYGCLYAPSYCFVYGSYRLISNRWVEFSLYGISEPRYLYKNLFYPILWSNFMVFTLIYHNGDLVQKELIEKPIGDVFHIGIDRKKKITSLMPDGKIIWCGLMFKKYIHLMFLEELLQNSWYFYFYFSTWCPL